MNGASILRTLCSQQYASVFVECGRLKVGLARRAAVEQLMKELILSQNWQSEVITSFAESGATDEAVPERRRTDRSIDTQNVAIFNHRTRLICDLMNLSAGGAKLRILDGTVPALCEPLALMLLDGTLVPAVVAWINTNTIGLEFLKPLTEPEQHLVFEAMGRGYYGKAIELQKHFCASSSKP